MECPSCNTNNHGNRKSCSNCGVALDNFQCSICNYGNWNGDEYIQIPYIDVERFTNRPEWARKLVLDIHNHPGDFWFAIKFGYEQWKQGEDSRRESYSYEKYAERRRLERANQTLSKEELETRRRLQRGLEQMGSKILDEPDPTSSRPTETEETSFTEKATETAKKTGQVAVTAGMTAYQIFGVILAIGFGFAVVFGVISFIGDGASVVSSKIAENEQKKQEEWRNPVDVIFEANMTAESRKK